MQAFVPKNRKPKFDLILRIIDLNNIPLVCGTVYVKWHLASSTTAEHRGRTDKSLIRDHNASWDYRKELQVRMTVDRSGMLHDSEMHFEILQEYSTGGRGDRIQLGNIKLNLAEYVEQDEEDDEEGVTRRYLMQESKINSTLKIGIRMIQIEGDRNFACPPLKTAQVFGGIAGIVAGDPGDADENGHMPSITSKTRELGELQDMYRRTLAASWACRAGELSPQDLIENLFGGGSGCRANVIEQSPAEYLNAEIAGSEKGQSDMVDDSGSVSDASSKLTAKLPTTDWLRPPSPSVGKHSRHSSIASGYGNDNPASPMSGMSGMSGRQVTNGEKERRRKRHVRQGGEITEFDVRDNLKTWQISPSQ